jgi:hypothetical protein
MPGGSGPPCDSECFENRASVGRAVLRRRGPEAAGSAWNAPLSVRAEIAAWVELVEAEEMQYVAFLGEPTWIDFSQFQPRGHYTRSELLSRYFRAVVWLGRVDLVLEPRGERPRPREEAAARALARALEQSGAIPLFDHMDGFYAAFVGQSNTLTPKALLALCAEAGLDACEGKAARMDAVYAAQPSPAYSSRVFAGPVPPLTMRSFPQRFAYDAWVTSQTTTPRLEPAVPGGRAMASPRTWPSRSATRARWSITRTT